MSTDRARAFNVFHLPQLSRVMPNRGVARRSRRRPHEVIFRYNARHYRAARPVHWHLQSPVTSAFFPAAAPRTAFCLAAAPLPIASSASRACPGTARRMVACYTRRRPGNLTSPPQPTVAGAGSCTLGPASTSVASPGTTPRASPATRPGSPRPRLGPTSARTTSVARVQATAGCRANAPSASWGRPTAGRTGPSSR